MTDNSQPNNPLHGVRLIDNIILRDRLSHSKVKLTQRLLVFKNYGYRKKLEKFYG